MSKFLNDVPVWISRVIAKIKREIVKYSGANTAMVIQLFDGEYLPELKFTKIKMVVPARILQVENPRSLEIEGHFYAARYLLAVEDPEAIIDASTGIIFSGKKIVAQSSAWPHLWLALNSIPIPIFRNRVPEIDIQNCILIPSNSFYHSLIEDIPLFLYLLDLLDEPTILISKDANKWIKELVTLFPNRVIEVPRYFKSKKIFLISRGGDSGWPHPTDIEILRKEFLPVLVEPPASFLYVSRLKSSRSPIFEAELCRVLETLGWRITYMEDLSLVEQIKIFSSAHVVAGVHGAGLAGMVWMQSGNKVIELGPNRFVPCYARLASSLSLEYLRVEFEENMSSLSPVLTSLTTFSESSQ